MYGEALFEAATCPKELVVFPGVAHNDVIERAGPRWAAAIASFAGRLERDVAVLALRARLALAWPASRAR